MKTEESYIEGLKKLLAPHQKIRSEQLQATKKVWGYSIIPLLIGLLAIPVYWKINPVMGWLFVLIALAIAYYILVYYAAEPQKVFEDYSLQKIVPLFYKNYSIDCLFNSNKSILKTELNSVFPISEHFEFKTRYLLQNSAHHQQTFRVSELRVLQQQQQDTTEQVFEGLIIDLTIPYLFDADIFVVPKTRKLSFWYENTVLKAFRIKEASFFSKYSKKWHLFAKSEAVAAHLLRLPMLEQLHSKRHLNPSIRIVNQQLYILIPQLQLLTPDMLDNQWSQQNLQHIYQQIRLVFDWIQDFSHSIDTELEG